MGGEIRGREESLRVCRGTCQKDCLGRRARGFATLFHCLQVCLLCNHTLQKDRRGRGQGRVKKSCKEVQENARMMFHIRGQNKFQVRM